MDDRYRNPEAFIADVKRALRDHNKTNAALARAMGQSPSAIARWFNRRVTPSVGSMIKMDDALHKLLYG